jgi:chorismate mutase
MNSREAVRATTRKLLEEIKEKNKNEAVSFTKSQQIENT